MTKQPPIDRPDNPSRQLPPERLPPTEVHGRGHTPSEPGLPSRTDPPRQIGPYRILELLGQGGMGTVYLAQQEEPLRRQVALKIIRSLVLSDEHRLRFAAEEKALARMSHPYVAQVYDAGTTETNEPYFVMERVAGQSMVRFCNEHRLTIRQRLELFLKVCDGVEHAHQKGIIHRDLKPSNILVTEVEGQPVPKIIDFGVAKAIDQPFESEQALTRFGMVGTPGYWSPEAVTGSKEHDTRTDVYSLGLTLFELLVGLLPFPRSPDSLVTHLKRIAEQDPPSLIERLASVDPPLLQKLADRRRTTSGQLRRDLQGDLTWIVARAVSRQKERRYPSASAMSADLRRHLDDRPIEAGPPRNLERFSKLVRRHRGAAAAATLVIASLIGGFTARTFEARRANQEAARANREAANAQRVSEFLIELFEINDPSQGRGDQITAREILDRGAEKLRSEVDQEPLTRAALMHTVGSVYNSLGLPSQGETFATEALDLRRQYLEESDPQVVESLGSLIGLLVESGQFSEAEVHARELVNVEQRRVGPDHPDLAGSMNRLAIVLHNQSKFEESVRWQQRSIDILQTAGANDLDAYHVGLNHLGALYVDMGRQEDAIRTLELCLEVRERVLGPEADDVAQTLNNLALVMIQDEKFQPAINYLERSLNIREKALGPDHPNLVWGLRLLGRALTLSGSVQPAEETLQRCLDIQLASIGRQHPFTALTLEALGDLRRVQQRYPEAEAFLRESLAIADEKLGEDHYSRGYYLHTLGNILRDASRKTEALDTYRQSIALLTSNLGANHPAVDKVEEDLARL